MVFVASGLNHKTAPLVLREKLARLSTPESNLLEFLLEQPFIHEALILSTCNRTEIYCVLDEKYYSPHEFLIWLLNSQMLSTDEVLPHLYQYENDEALTHLLRVASGLDSMMLGEPQILGQLKQAYRDANDKGGTHVEFGHLFPFVFNASKKIRTQSGIGNNPVSIASAAVRLISESFSHFKALEVFVIGSGETAALVSKYLYQQGVRRFTIASRTQENADSLALNWDANAISITDIPLQLTKADVVISATACPLPFIDKMMIEQAIGLSREKPLFLLDLAVPRDINPDTASLDYIELYNIDDLHLAIEKNLDEKRSRAGHAETFIPSFIESYNRLHRMRYADKAICNYRKQMQELAKFELNRTTQKIESGNSHIEAISELSERLLNKLIHATTEGLRQAAADNRQELVDLTHYLLNAALPAPKHEEITQD